MRPMAKETHIKTDKKTVGGWGAWELQFYFLFTVFYKITVVPPHGKFNFIIFIAISYLSNSDF